MNLKESISYFVFQSTFIHNASLNNHTNQIKPIMRTETITGEVIRPSLSKRIMIGAAIGLAVISYFVLTANGGNPEWGRFWMIRPLILVPFAGAMGGLVSFFMVQLADLNGWNKVLVNIFSVLVFIIGLWMGIVLGLDGTMWD